MKRRPQLEERFQAWLRQVGARVADVRKDLGLTQPEAAERCQLDYKHYQAIEYGRARMTAHTLFTVAEGLGVSPRELLPWGGPDTANSAAHDLGLADLRVAGWRVVSGGEGRPSETFAVPIFDLRAAAGALADDTATPEIRGWAALPPGRHLDTEGLFLAQVLGTSMEPRVPDGAWCLFRQPVAPPLLGRVVLVRMDPTATGDAAAFQLKKIGALVLDDTGVGVRVRLDSFNKAQPPIEVVAPTEAEVQVLGELVEVVRPSPSQVTK